MPNPRPGPHATSRFLLRWAAPDADHTQLRRYLAGWTQTPEDTARLIGSFAGSIGVWIAEQYPDADPLTMVAPDGPVPHGMNPAHMKAAAVIANNMLGLAAKGHHDGVGFAVQGLLLDSDPQVLILAILALLAVAAETMKTAEPTPIPEETDHA